MNWKPLYNYKQNPDTWCPCWVLWGSDKKPRGMVTQCSSGWTWVVSGACAGSTSTLKQAKYAVEVANKVVHAAETHRKAQQ